MGRVAILAVAIGVWGSVIGLALSAKANVASGSTIDVGGNVWCDAGPRASIIESFPDERQTSKNTRFCHFDRFGRIVVTDENHGGAPLFALGERA